MSSLEDFKKANYKPSAPVMGGNAKFSTWNDQHGGGGGFASPSKPAAGKTAKSSLTSGASFSAPNSSDPNKPYVPMEAPQDNPALSFLGWMGDMVSRPLFGTTNAINAAADRQVEITKKQAAGDFGGAALDSAAAALLPGVDFLAGVFNFGNNEDMKRYGHATIEHVTDKFGSLNPEYEDTADNVNPWVKGIGGFAVDVFADPLTYLPGVGWAAKGAGLAARGAIKASEAAAEGGSKIAQVVLKGGQKLEKASEDVAYVGAKYLDNNATAAGKALVEARDLEKAARVFAISAHPDKVLDWATRVGKADKLPKLLRPDAKELTKGLNSKQILKQQGKINKWIGKKANLKPLEEFIGSALEPLSSIKPKIAAAALVKSGVAKSLPLFDDAIKGMPKSTNPVAWTREFGAWRAKVTELVKSGGVSAEDAAQLREIIKSVKPKPNGEVYVQGVKDAHNIASGFIRDYKAAHFRATDPEYLAHVATEAQLATPSPDIIHDPSRPKFTDTFSPPMSPEDIAAHQSAAAAREASVIGGAEGTRPKFSKDFTSSANKAVIDLGKTSDTAPAAIDKVADVLPTVEALLKDANGNLRSPASRSAATVAAGKLDEVATTALEAARLRINDSLHELEGLIADRVAEGSRDPALLSARAAYEARSSLSRVQDQLLALAQDGVFEGETDARLFLSAGIREVSKTDISAITNVKEGAAQAQKSLALAEDGAKLEIDPELGTFATRDNLAFIPDIEQSGRVVSPPMYEFTTLSPEVEKTLLKLQADRAEKLTKDLFDKGVIDPDTVADIIARDLQRAATSDKMLVDAIVANAKSTDILVDALGAEVVKMLRSTKVTSEMGAEVFEALRTVVFKATGVKPAFELQSLKNLRYGKNGGGDAIGSSARSILAHDTKLRYEKPIKAAEAAKKKAIATYGKDSPEAAKATGQVKSLMARRDYEQKGADYASFDAVGASDTMEFAAAAEANAIKDPVQREIALDKLKTLSTSEVDGFITPKKLEIDPKTGKEAWVPNVLSDKQSYAMMDAMLDSYKDTLLLRDAYDVAKLIGPEGEPTVLARVLHSLGVEPATRIVSGKQTSSFVSRVGQKVEVLSYADKAKTTRLLKTLTEKGAIPAKGLDQLKGSDVGKISDEIASQYPEAAAAMERVLDSYAEMFLFPPGTKPVEIIMGPAKKGSSNRATYLGHATTPTITLHMMDRAPEQLAFFMAHELGHHLDATLGVMRSLEHGNKEVKGIVEALRSKAPEMYSDFGDHEVVADAIHYYVAMQTQNSMLITGVTAARASEVPINGRAAVFLLDDEAMLDVYRATARYLSSRGVLKVPDNAMAGQVSTAPELVHETLETALSATGHALKQTKNLEANDASFLQTAIVYGNWKAALDGTVEGTGVLGTAYAKIKELKLKGSEAAIYLARYSTEALSQADELMHQAGRPLLFMAPGPGSVRVPMSYATILRVIGNDPEGAQVLLRTMFNRGGSLLATPDKQGFQMTQVAWTKVADAVADIIARGAGTVTKEETYSILTGSTQLIKGVERPMANGLAHGGKGRYYNAATDQWEENFANDLAVQLTEQLHKHADTLVAHSVEMAAKYVKLGVEESGDMQRKLINDFFQKMFQTVDGPKGPLLDENGLFHVARSDNGEVILKPGWQTAAVEEMAKTQTKLNKLADEGAAMDSSVMDAAKEMSKAFEPSVLEAAGHRMATVEAQMGETTLEGAHEAGKKFAQARSDAEARAVLGGEKGDASLWTFTSIAKDRVDVPAEIQARMAGLLHNIRVGFSGRYLMENVFDIGQSHTAMTGMWNAPRNQLLRDIAHAGGVVKGSKNTLLDLAWSTLASGSRTSGDAGADALIPMVEQYLEPLLSMAYSSNKVSGNVLFQNNMEVGLLNRAIAKEFGQKFNPKDPYKFAFDFDSAKKFAQEALNKYKASGHKVGDEEKYLQTSAIKQMANQWRKWPVDDPLGFMKRFDNAVTTVYGQMALGHSLRARAFRMDFASATPKAGFAKIKDFNNNAIYSVLDSNTYYNKEYLYEINRLGEFLNAPKSPEGEIGKFLRDYYDPIQNMWKELVTIRRPGHHVRNEVGDLTLTFGIEGHRFMGQSLKDALAMMSLRNEYDGVDIIQAWNHLDGIDLGHISRTEAKETARIATGSKELPKATKVITKGKFGESTMGQLHEAIRSFGLLRVARDIEDINVESMSKVQGITDKLMMRDTKFDEAFKSISEVREHHVRISHFLQIVYKAQKDGYIHLGYKGKYKPTDMNDLFRVASEQVKKYHPDSSMMTTFELRYMRRAIPFYSWFRSAIPAVIESSLTHPGRALIAPKASYNLAVANGVDPDSLGDPFPDDQQFPSFLRENILGPQFKIGDSYIGINPGVSSVDIANMLFNPDPLREVAGMITPIVRIPAEMLSGGSWSTGGRINDMSDYVDSSIPFLGPLSNVTGYSMTGSAATLVQGKGLDTQYGVDRNNKTALDAVLAGSNFMLGMNVQNQSRPNYIKFAQFEEREKKKLAEPGARSGY